VRVALVLVVLAALAVLPRPALAIEHGNLDEGRPTRFEDPYAIPLGEWSVEVGGGFRDARHGDDRAAMPVDILYGAAPNMQIGLGTVIFTHPRSLGGESSQSGDVRVSALFNFSQESLSLPALGIKWEMVFPTGVDSRGLDARLKALVTKSISRLSFHVNASELFRGDPSPVERGSRYELDYGLSYPLGAPKHTRMLLLLGGFAEESAARGFNNRRGVEIGLRRQQSLRTVVDAGFRIESDGGEERANIFNAGLSWSY
jgi:hypothetical protein